MIPNIDIEWEKVLYCIEIVKWVPILNMIPNTNIEWEKVLYQKSIFTFI